MYVNPFWLGVLLTLVGLVILSIILSIIHSHDDEEEGYTLTAEEFQELLNQITGDHYKVVEKGGCWYGEIIEDDEDDDCK